jgi:SPP1 family phage portal protein
MIHQAGAYWRDNTVITDQTLLFGRKQILLNIPRKRLTEEELGSILRRAFLIHNTNAEDINYLYHFYRGNQSILQRSDKLVRPEIDNRTVENWAKYVTNFKLGFIFGEPIQLIKNSNGNSLLSVKDQTINENNKDKQVVILNDYFQESDKHTKDKECGFWMLVGGVGYMCVLPNDDQMSNIPFRVYSLDPRSTFVIYGNDFKKEPVMAVTFTVIEGLEEGKYDYQLTVYTKDFIYEAFTNQDFEKVQEFKVSRNMMEMIPIVEFNHDNVRQGAFEHIISLLDNINLISSDRMNDVEQAVQWFMKFINVDIDDELYERFKSKGVIVVKGEPGNTPVVDSVNNVLNQQQVQVFKDDMIRSLHILSNVPEREIGPGNNTGQALVIGQGWADAEADAKNVEAGLKKGQKELLKIGLKIAQLISTVPQEVKTAAVESIDIKFTRNRSDNLLVKTQSLQNMLKAGVHPLLAFKLCGLFDDPQKAYELSKETLTKMEQVMTGQDQRVNNGEGPISSGNGQNSSNQTEEAQKDLERNE